jgi:pyrroline-5-carboxylate reductase
MSIRIACIGGGNMGRAILGGLVRRGHDPATIRLAEPREAARAALAEELGVAVTADNRAAAADSEVLLLAVKPQQMKEVVVELAPTLALHYPLLLSIAAGIPTAALAAWAGSAVALVRAMPNTPALIGRGVTALYATPNTAAADRTRAADLLAAVGGVVWVAAEEELDAVTALSGSGPAYFFLFMECLERAAVSLGLPAVTARRLAVETAAGACELALRSPLAPDELRAQVTSEGGTTAAALEVFAARGFEPLVAAALDAAARRAAALGTEFGAT